MFSFVSDFLAMYDQGDALVIDGCLYAPVEQVAYSVVRYWTAHLAFIACVSVLVFAVLCFAVWYAKSFTLDK